MKNGMRIVYDIRRGDGSKPMSVFMTDTQMEWNSNIFEVASTGMRRKKTRRRKGKIKQKRKTKTKGLPNSTFCSAVSLGRRAILVWMVQTIGSAARLGPQP